MAISAAGTITIDAVLSAVENLDLSVDKKADLTKAIRQVFTSGAGAGQFERLFVDERPLGGGATDALDFSGGGLLDVLGGAWAPGKLKFLIVQNLGPNDIQVVRPANGIPIYTSASGGEQIPSGGILVKIWPSAAGVAVTTGTGDLLNIVNTATAANTYQIIAGGAGAAT
jgi:hypothetical protein